MDTFYWDVGDIPFVCEMLDTPNNRFGIPNLLPFSVFLNEYSGVLTQNIDDNIQHCLTVAYENGSIIGGNMGDEGIGSQYAEYFIEFIQKTFKVKRFSNLDILEIGCGSGYLLYRLKNLGATVIGIEPSALSQENINKYKINIIKDFFPSKMIKKKFDIIILSCVLEHLIQPITLLKDIKKHLKENGKIIISVEDEEPYINLGDISIFFHEHISYYTEKSLRKTLKICGFENIIIDKSKFSKLLMCSATSGKDLHIIDNDTESINSEIIDFHFKALKIKQKFLDFILDTYQLKKTVGIYVPGRAINLISMIKGPLHHIRFFDDDQNIQHKFFPDIDIFVESRDMLVKNPTDYLLIMSLSFGDKLKKDLEDIIPNTEIFTMEEFFNMGIINVSK